MFGKFYKIDNMIQENYSKGYDFFGEAYTGKTGKDITPFHLNKKSIKPKKGAMYFAVYKGPDLSLEDPSCGKLHSPVQSLNDVPNWIDENANEPKVKKIKVNPSVNVLESSTTASSSSSPVTKEGIAEGKVKEGIEVTQRDQERCVEAESEAFGPQEKLKDSEC